MGDLFYGGFFLLFVLPEFEEFSFDFLALLDLFSVC
jgi:hypothetical protein